VGRTRHPVVSASWRRAWRYHDTRNDYRFVQIALKRNPTNVVPLEGADLDVALEAQPAEKIEPTATA